MKKLSWLFVFVLMLSLIGCGTESTVLEPEIQEDIIQIEEAPTESEKGDELPSTEELLNALNSQRMDNVNVKLQALIDAYKDLRAEDDGYDIIRISIMEGGYQTKDIVLPVSVGNLRVFKNGLRPTVDWAGHVSIIKKFINRVNLGEEKNPNGAEWFLSFEDQDDFLDSKCRKEVYNFTDEEIEAEKEREVPKTELYMYTATTMAATMAQYEGLITYGEIFETTEYTTLNGLTSAYAVPIILDGVDYGIIAVFNEEDLMLNIISTDDSQKETWYYYSM